MIQTGIGLVILDVYRCRPHAVAVLLRAVPNQIILSITVTPHREGHAGCIDVGKLNGHSLLCFICRYGHFRCRLCNCSTQRLTGCHTTRIRAVHMRMIQTTVIIVLAGIDIQHPTVSGFFRAVPNQIILTAVVAPHGYFHILDSRRGRNIGRYAEFVITGVGDIGAIISHACYRDCAGHYAGHFVVDYFVGVYMIQANIGFVILDVNGGCPDTVHFFGRVPDQIVLTAFVAPHGERHAGSILYIGQLDF